MTGGAWLAVTFVLILVAVLLRQPPLLLVAILFFLASLVARLWAAGALQRVEYIRRLSTNRAFFGDTITLEVGIANRKLLPLPWFHVEDEVPDALKYLKGNVHLSNKPTRAILSNFMSLTWYHRLVRRYPVACARRGVYVFGPAKVRSGDPFGLFQRESEVMATDSLLVYPRIVSLETLGITSRNPFGDIRVRRHLFEDPIRVASVREYVHGDPLKRIHWKASARLRTLQSRVLETSTTVDLALFLDGRTVLPPSFGGVERLLETAIMAAASIAQYSAKQGYRVGLYSNEWYRGTDRVIRLPPSDHPEQLQRILEALAHLQGWPLHVIEDVIAREARSLSWSATITAVTAAPTDSLLATLERFRRAGRKTSLVLVGDQAGTISSPGLPVFRVSEQVYLKQLESLGLVPTGAR